MRWPWEPADYDDGVYVSRQDQNYDKPTPRQWFVDYLPVTGDNEVDLFVDGETYMSALYDALMGAKYEVLMTGLHFDPGLLLRRQPRDLVDTRPGREGTVYDGMKDDGVFPHFGPHGRPELLNHPDSLLQVLKRVARNDKCKIYLIVNQFWKAEGKGAAGIDPARGHVMEAQGLIWYLSQTTALFEGLAGLENVFCRTDVHPRHVMSTHHQKTVVIDRKVCFVGGIDLTATDGDRWDTHAHEIPALGAMDRRQYALAEHLWHDVHCRIRGRAVQFVLDNFRARWNHGQFFKDLKWNSPEIIWDHGVPYANQRREIVAKEDPEPKPRDLLMAPDHCYQALSRQYESGPKLHSRATEDWLGRMTGKALGKEPLEGLSGTLVQVVRSMPEGRYWDGTEHWDQFQKPFWNLAHEPYERSAKDAYLIGIRAAREYIYLENQWVTDEDIWEELRRAIWRNRKAGNHKFRIVVVIPRRPLVLAGLGKDQDLFIGPLAQKVRDECKDDPRMFGMYSLVQTIPDNRRRRVNEAPFINRDWIALSDDDVKDFGDVEAQIYVHSKILIVDDCWSLIGSANAGGISLAGTYNPNTMAYAGSTPDTELSVIIYDQAFAKKFRESLWKEHLQCDPPGAPDAGADLFRSMADQGNKRVRHATVVRETSQEAAVTQRHVLLARVRDTARIVRTLTVEDPAARHCTVSEPRATERLPLRASAGGTSFRVELMPPPPPYTLWYWWRFLDERGGRWQLRSTTSDSEAKHYDREPSARLGAKTMEGLRAQTGMTGLAKVICRVLMTPAGVAPPPFHENADDPEGFTVELELELDRS